MSTLNEAPKDNLILCTVCGDFTKKVATHRCRYANEEDKGVGFWRYRCESCLHSGGCGPYDVVEKLSSSGVDPEWEAYRRSLASEPPAPVPGPCPFCDSKDVRRVTISAVGGAFTVCCVVCGARGKTEPTTSAATESWNRPRERGRFWETKHEESEAELLAIKKVVGERWYNGIAGGLPGVVAGLVGGLALRDSSIARLTRILGKLSRVVFVRAGKPEFVGTPLEQLDAIGHLMDWAAKRTEARHAGFFPAVKAPEKGGRE